jgi:hypothetical protein
MVVPGEIAVKGGACAIAAAASAWLSAGVSVAAVAAWLGDTQQTVLDTYSHLMPDDTDRGRRAMDQFFLGSALDVPSAGPQ